MSIIVITETEDEYGYTLYVGVALTKESALEICKKILQEKNNGCEMWYDVNTNKYTIGFNDKQDQIGFLKNGIFYNTLYYLEEVDVR